MRTMGAISEVYTKRKKAMEDDVAITVHVKLHPNESRRLLELMKERAVVFCELDLPVDGLDHVKIEVKF